MGCWEIYDYCLDKNGLIDLDKFRGVCKNSEYNEFLDLLLESYKREIAEAENFFVDSPISVYGEWKNFGELKRLGNSWSDLEMMEILEYGVNPLERREVEGIFEYFVDYDSVGSFMPYEEYKPLKKAFKEFSNYSGMVEVLGEEIDRQIKDI